MEYVEVCFEPCTRVDCISLAVYDDMTHMIRSDTINKILHHIIIYFTVESKTRYIYFATYHDE